jgi:hypothetical protein
LRERERAKRSKEKEKEKEVYRKIREKVSRVREKEHAILQAEKEKKAKERELKKLKPRRASSPLNCYVKERFSSVYTETKSLPNTMKKLSDEWKALSDEKKLVTSIFLSCNELIVSFCSNTKTKAQKIEPVT